MLGDVVYYITILLMLRRVGPQVPELSLPSPWKHVIPSVGNGSIFVLKSESNIINSKVIFLFLLALLYFSLECPVVTAAVSEPVLR